MQLCAPPGVAARPDYSLSLFVFFGLQVLDVVTTHWGLQAGLGEASMFIRWLMQFGTLPGLLASKVIAVVLGGYFVKRGRFGFIRLVNCWYVLLVGWNLALLYLHSPF